VLALARQKLAAEDDTRASIRRGEYLFESKGYDELFESLEVVGPEDSIQ
jgi:4-hydroxy-4-methyl-2-oxoglutarate aldolase